MSRLQTRFAQLKEQNRAATKKPFNTTRNKAAITSNKLSNC